MEYKTLEPNIINGIGGKGLTFNTNSAPSLFTSVSFLYTLFFVVIVVVASSKYAQAGLLRMEASESGIKKSNDVFKKTTLGLLGVFSLWLILATVNKDLLTGDVGLANLKANLVNNGSFGGGLSTSQSSGSGSTRACEPEANVKAAISSGNICKNASCTLSSSCLNKNPYIDIIKTESSKLGVDYRMVVVIMCKESGANPIANNQNPNGSHDCGLMQINQQTLCDKAILDPATNIAKGVALLGAKKNNTSVAHVYPSIPAQAGVFAAYNVGEAYTTDSASCTSANGWPSIPKWACPVDPGSGQFNMCGVKDYACTLTVCLNDVP